MRRFIAVAAAMVAAVGLALLPAGTAAPAALPPLQPNVVQNGPWTCDEPVNINLVKVTMNVNDDAISLAANCEGRIGRVEVDGIMADGIKIQNASVNAAHDLVIEGGYVNASGTFAGAHQDGLQAMGGARVTFRNVAFDMPGGGGGNFFVNRAGSGVTTPTDIVCEHCAFGARHNNPAAHVRINVSVRSGARDSLACRGQTTNPYSFAGAEPVNVNNIVVENVDARCTEQGLKDWAAGGSPPPPPPPPPPAYDPVCAPTCDEQIASQGVELGRLNDIIDAAQAELDDQ